MNLPELFRIRRVKKEIEQEALVSSVDALWTLVEHMREMHRDIYQIRTGGVWIRFKEDGDNIKIANHITKRVWPAVDKMPKARKNRLLHRSRKRDILIAEKKGGP